jgi:NADH-quinone oxidoreductase subunit K
MIVTMVHYQIVSVILFCCGIFGFLSRRNLTHMLIAVALMFSAGFLNCIAANSLRFSSDHYGSAWAIIMVTLAVIQIAVGLAVAVRLFSVTHDVACDVSGDSTITRK